MTTFREFLDRRESARAEQAKVLARSRATKFSAEDFLKMHAAQEWAGLQDRLWSLVEKEEVSGQRFFRRQHAIGLGSVLVSFVSQASKPSASPCLFDLVFSRDEGDGHSVPATPHGQADHWKMRAAVSEGEILWTRADVPCRHAETADYMAHQIATKLVESYDKHERAAGRDQLFVTTAMTPQRG